MVAQPLFRSDSVTLDGTGSGTVTIAVPNGVTWSITKQSVRVPNGTIRADVLVLVNGHFLEGTYQGNRDSSDTLFEVNGGDTIECQWISGSPGERAIYSIWGRQK